MGVIKTSPDILLEQTSNDMKCQTDIFKTTSQCNPSVNTNQHNVTCAEMIHEDFTKSPQQDSEPKMNIIATINDIRDTVDSLETSLKLSRGLEAEQWKECVALRMQNTTMVNDLREANKRNKNMLNLFRQSVTDFRLDNIDTLPEHLKKKVQHTWHQKYDALLAQNEQLRNETNTMVCVVKEKNKQIEILQERLLNISESLTEREEAIKNVCTKYLNLKKRKDERELILISSIQELEGTLRKANNAAVSGNVPFKSGRDALLEREIRRGDRLAYENSVLRVLLTKSRRERNASRSNDTISFGKHV